MRVKCKCKREACGWEWTSSISGGPKCCPGCHSTQWRKKNKGVAVNDKIKMICSICNKNLVEGQTIYRFQEGKNISGAFILESEESQGVYCENCAPEEDALPFAK